VRRHETDVTSLVFGLVFVGAALLWALVQAEVLSTAMLALALPLLLVAVGAVGVAAALARQRRSEPSDSDPHLDPYLP
jgi:apolipoprotein N-acyltransferase